ncbi:MAG: adenine deaminase, partial [bacterium]
MLHNDIEHWGLLLEAARGERPCDLLIRNVKIVDVLSGTIREGDVAIYDGRIVGFGDYPASQIWDGKGKYLAPG